MKRARKRFRAWLERALESQFAREPGGRGQLDFEFTSIVSSGPRCAECGRWNYHLATCSRRKAGDAT